LGLAVLKHLVFILVSVNHKRQVQNDLLEAVDKAEVENEGPCFLKHSAYSHQLNPSVILGFIFEMLQIILNDGLVPEHRPRSDFVSGGHCLVVIEKILRARLDVDDLRALLRLV
jgi:hypothetical protein